MLRFRRESVTNPSRFRRESATHTRRCCTSFANIRAKMKRVCGFRLKTSLIFRYEFAALSPQTRYAFVAILLYCGANGIDEIPLDAKFMSSALIIDERTLRKSFDELLFKNLLQERKDREKEKTDTDRQDARDARVCVTNSNSFQNKSENQNHLSNGNLLELSPLDKINSNGNGNHSQFTIEECLRYVEVCQSKGEKVQSPKALARNLYQTGTSDAFIMNTLYPERTAEEEARKFGEPILFTDNPCAVCFGAKLSDADGKGYRGCVHCKNERGKSTGFEPKGEQQ